MTYQEMYFYLYEKMADALDCFYTGNLIQGIYILEQAHIKTEEIKDLHPIGMKVFSITSYRGRKQR